MCCSFAIVKKLHTPRVKTRLGFLYARFRHGAEFWELVSLVRKMSLCGLLVFLPETARAVMAIMICLANVAMLNMYQAPKNRIVFWGESLWLFSGVPTVDYILGCIYCSNTDVISSLN